VPFPENFAAVFIRAAQKTDNLSWHGVSMLKNDELFGFWHVLFDANLFQIKDVWWHDLEDGLWSDVFILGNMLKNVKAVFLFDNLSRHMRTVFQ
jgi:hypothetical protein